LVCHQTSQTLQQEEDDETLKMFSFRKRTFREASRRVGNQEGCLSHSTISYDDTLDGFHTVVDVKIFFRWFVPLLCGCQINQLSIITMSKDGK